MLSRLMVACALAAVTGFAPSSTTNAAVPTGIMMNADGGVMVHDAWARATPGGATTGAAYVTVMGGDQPDTLVGASTTAARTAEVHETINDNGVMKMRPVAGIPVPAHKAVTFSPGGYHVMLTGLRHPLVAGQTFPLTLRFAHAAPVTVDVKVQAMGHAAPMGDHMKM